MLLGGAPAPLRGDASLTLHPKLAAALKATLAATTPFWCAPRPAALPARALPRARGALPARGPARFGAQSARGN